MWAYKRDDLGEDPADLRVKDGCEYLAQRGVRLIEVIGRIPGQDRATKVEQREVLAEWLKKVRQSCTELGREEIGDICLGEFLSKAPKGEDGVWPQEAVRDVMEEMQSEFVSRGAYTGLYNERGAYLLKEGGDQERELAEMYRGWAEALQFTHPFVSSTLLMSMVKTYDFEAEQRDTEARAERSLRH